ncbi:MAG: thiamine-phosphate kinase [Mycobacteriaceae bacterium]
MSSELPAGEFTVADIGEFGLIARETQARVQPKSTLLGPGDDAALVQVANGKVLISTDVLVQDRHFRLDWSTPRQIGRKAIAQNAADIESMGGSPTSFVIGLACPESTPVVFIDELTEGLWQEAEKLGAGIVGGDVVSADSLVISVTVLGDLLGQNPILRSGAVLGDIVAVAGELGSSGAGLSLLENANFDFPHLIELHQVPSPPYGAGSRAALAGVHAMTDISDGLIADLGHLALASEVSMNLSTALLSEWAGALVPASQALGVDLWNWVFGGGEDHALAATFAPDAPLPKGWKEIGVVHALDSNPRVVIDGQPWLGAAGWQSWSKNSC